MSAPGGLEPIALGGSADGSFAPVADVFARLMAEQGANGTLAVYHRGRMVVDLRAGESAPGELQLLFSISKLVTAIACQRLHESGQLDLDAPLSDCWPAMGRPATASITTRDVLSHRSGLAATDRVVSLADLVARRDVDAVEQQDPYWEPGTAHGYHSFTFGTLLDQVFRRTLGRAVGELVRELISVPLGLDLRLGLAEAELARVRPVRYRPPTTTPARAAFAERSTIPPGTTSRLAREMDVYNSPELLRLGLPSTSAVGAGRDLARMLAATLGPVDGVELLSQSSREAMTAARSDGLDRVLGVITAFGSGAQLPFPMFAMLGPRSFGHEAAGGSAVLADPDLELAVGFTCDLFPSQAGASPAFQALLPALRWCCERATTDPEEQS